MKGDVAPAPLDPNLREKLEPLTCGMSKEEADDAFLRRMQDSCEPGVSGTLCRLAAQAYHWAVSAGAGRFYDEGQAECFPETHRSQVEPEETGSACGF
jgi:hypothetical protein